MKSIKKTSIHENSTNTESINKKSIRKKSSSKKLAHMKSIGEKPIIITSFSKKSDKSFINNVISGFLLDRFPIAILLYQ